MKKRILLVTDVYNWGGHIRAKYIRKYLEDEFHFDIMDANEFNIWERRSDPRLFSMDDITKFSKLMKRDFFDFEKFRRFVDIHKSKRNYDIYYFLFHTMLAKKSVQRLLHTNSKIMTIVTGFPTLKNIFYGRDFNQEKAKKNFLSLANRCKAVGANNYKSLDDLKEIYDPKKTFYAPRGVDPEVFYPMTTEFKRKEDEWKFTIAYVGKPVPEKGLKEFIQPACEQAGVSIIFNDRNYENALPPDEMNKFYNQADAYVVASTIDGTPNPALEAASCGKPVIANEIGNMPEFIKDGENGFLLKGDIKVERYAQKLRWMKVNQKRTFEMGQNARETIEKKWTWERVVNQHEREVFRRLL